ncbi:MAG: porin [Flavobacteriales bacterium]|nr:porin [Flavobacteriales bacterium]
MKKSLLFTTLFFFNLFFAQEKSDFKINFSGFLETYYAFDLNQPTTETKLPFMYNYNRHNEFNVNIGLLRAKVEYENAYANIALHSGTYVDDNYANEKIKYLNEAFVGLYLDQAKKNTIEVGILPSYIGFESATTATNLTLTRSILAENSPYFMTGVKYNYKPNAKWSFSGLVTNGWQRINRPEKDVIPAFGTQIIYKSSDNSTLNWSTFAGKEYYGTELAMRYFSNAYWDYKWNSKWRTIVGFDYGLQDVSSRNQKHESWLSPVAIAQYSLSSKWQTAFRVEYYQDKKNIIIATNDAFETMGFSFNADYLFDSKVKWRTEARYLDSKEKVFVKEDDLINSNFFLTTSLSFEF